MVYEGVGNIKEVVSEDRKTYEATESVCKVNGRTLLAITCWQTNQIYYL